MSEKLKLNNAESVEQSSDSYQRIQMLTSDVVMGQAKDLIAAELSSDESLIEYTRFTEQENQLAAKARESNDVSEQRQHYSQIDDIRHAKNQLPDGTSSRYDQLYHRYTMLDRYNIKVVSVDDFEADAILNIVSSAPKIQPEASQKLAPFSDFRENNQEVWQYVPDEAIDEYLDRRVFLAPERIRRLTPNNPKIRIEGSPEKLIEVPLDIMVGAQSFDSWKGYDGGSGGKRISGKYAEHYDRQVSSYDAIKHYASLPSDLPPINTVELFIQPDGQIFGDNGSGDSHRLAAAILRGDEKIKALNVTITPIDKNIF